jgi:leader peptidase (prepilin peptidase)/N-methyltransferase
MDLSHFAPLAHLALRSFEFPGIALAFVVLWLLVVGASIGSFLNVVVYRLPLGLSLVRPRSRCPRCGTPILARDNIPVLGWLLLGGRCRTCCSMISARYPLVELTTAVVFAGLAFAEPLGDAWNLPITKAEMLTYPLWASLSLHFALFCGLLGAALITYDDEAPPIRFWAFVWGLGFVLTTVWPRVRPIGVAQSNLSWLDSETLGPIVVSLLEGIAGTVLGVIVGIAAWPASTSQARARSGHIAGPAAGACLGVYLGYQAAAVIVVLATLVWSLWQILRYPFSSRRNLPWLAFVTATTLAWLFAWRAIWQRWPMIGWQTPPLLPLAAVGLTITVAQAGRTLADSSRRTRALNDVASSGA